MSAVKPTAVHAYLLDPLERGFWTFVQAAIPLLLPFATAAGLAGVPWLAVLDRAGFAGIASIVLSVLTFPLPKLSVAADFMLRVVRTFGATFAGSVFAAGVTPSVVHAPWQHSISLAIAAAFFALLKGLAAFAAPWSDGASLIPQHAALYDHAALEPDPQFAQLDSAAASTPPQTGPPAGTLIYSATGTVTPAAPALPAPDAPAAPPAPTA